MTFSEIINMNQPVLVDFHAEWCGPCKTMAPILKSVKSQLGEKVKILKVDIDKNNKAAREYHVNSVPTLILFKQNKIIWRQTGVINQADLYKKIISYI